MRRTSFPFLVLATALALLWPLEQAHCLWMGSSARPVASTKMAPDHSCCRGHAAPHGSAATPQCVCLQLPQAAVPHALVVAHPRPLPTLFATLVPSPVLAPARRTDPAFPAPDEGRPPSAAPPRALASRAPPRSA